MLNESLKIVELYNHYQIRKTRFKINNDYFNIKINVF